MVGFTRREGRNAPAKKSGASQNKLNASYHKFVKTTPKPKATKKSSGEVPPSSPPSSRPSLLFVVVSTGCEEDWVGEDTEDVGVSDEEEDGEWRSTPSSCRIWCSTALAITSEA